MTSRAESRIDADYRMGATGRARTPPGHPPASGKEAVNTSLDTTVPVMEVPLAAALLE